MFGILKRLRIIRNIRRLEDQQNRAVRELVVAITLGDDVPDRAKQKLKQLDAEITQLRQQHKTLR